jgi:hypothetical protein
MSVTPLKRGRRLTGVSVVAFRDAEDVVRKLRFPNARAHEADSQIRGLRQAAKTGEPLTTGQLDWVLGLKESTRTLLVKYGLVAANQLRAGRPLTEHLEEYLAEKRGLQRNRDHVQNIETQCRAGLDALKATYANEITRAGVERWLAGLLEQGKSPRTRNAHLTSLKGFTRWLARTGVLSRDPLEWVRRANVDRNRRRVRRALTDSEMVRVLSAALEGPPWRSVHGGSRLRLGSVAGRSGL